MVHLNLSQITKSFMLTNTKNVILTYVCPRRHEKSWKPPKKSLDFRLAESQSQPKPGFETVLVGGKMINSSFPDPSRVNWYEAFIMRVAEGFTATRTFELLCLFGNCGNFTPPTMFMTWTVCIWRNIFLSELENTCEICPYVWLWMVDLHRSGDQQLWNSSISFSFSLFLANFLN